tara:strand:+ start:145 stop:879 length:735 start_codon:yes stop_codon:yes gene_type:complete
MGLVLGTLFYQDPSFQEMIESVYSANLGSLEGKRADLMVPVFIIHYLPSGVIGILIVAIMSAAMSSLSSTINSLSAVTMEDFVKRFGTNISDKKYVYLSRIISVFWGLLCLFIAFFTGKIEGTVIEVINKIGSVFYGPIIGTFVLAIMTKKANTIGANIGILTGVFFNIFLWLCVPSIFWFWWNAIGFLITFSVGLVVSNLLRNKVSQTYEIKYFAEFKDILKLILYFLIILSISLILPNIFNL